VEQNSSSKAFGLSAGTDFTPAVSTPVWSTVSQGTNWLEILVTKPNISLLRCAFFWDKISLM
jgi:hypothetical protein